MNIIERCEYLIKLGYIYNKETGDITSPYGVICKTVNDRYLCIRIVRKSENIRINVYHHQYAWYCCYGTSLKCIDHINRDKLDNRIDNLREVSFNQNSWNQKKNSKGYSFNKGLYQARIRINGRLTSLGYYKTEEEAHKSYIDAKKLHHEWS
jgi:hypothetical protein